MDKAQLSITWRNHVNKSAELQRSAQSIYLSQGVTSDWGRCAVARKEKSLRVQYKGWLVIRLIATKCYERLLCYLSTYINLWIVGSLIWSRLLIQIPN